MKKHTLLEWTTDWNEEKERYRNNNYLKFYVIYNDLDLPVRKLTRKPEPVKVVEWLPSGKVKIEFPDGLFETVSSDKLIKLHHNLDGYEVENEQ